MSNKIEIPAGLKPRQRPATKLGDEVLYLDGVLHVGQTDTVRDIMDGEFVTKGWLNLGGFPNDSWAIVNGPVSKGDWVIALEYRYGVNQPDGRKLGDLLRVDGSPSPQGHAQGAVRAVDGTNGPRYLSKWAKVELADKPTEPTFRAGDRVIIDNPVCDPKWNGPGTIVGREPDDHRGRPWYYVHSDNYGGAGGFEAGNLKPLKPKKRTESQYETVSTRTWVDSDGDRWYEVAEDSWISPVDAGSGFEVHSGSFEKLVQKYGEN